MDTPHSTTALEHRTREPAPLTFDAMQRSIIVRSFMPGATEQEAVALIMTAERMGLDPFRRQIHFVKRRAQNEETQQWEERWAFQVAIDGFRSRAEDSGEYEGQDEPVFTYEPVINPMTGEETGRRQLVARVTVYRRGRRPIVGVARWLEFVQTKRNGDPVRMWREKPHHMLAKTAEAMALRLAFPERLGGLYTDDEMGREDDEGRTVASNVSPLSSAPAAPQGKQQSAPRSDPRPGFTGDDAKDIAVHVEALKKAGSADAFKSASDAARARWPQERPVDVRAAYTEAKKRIDQASAPPTPAAPARCDGNHADPRCADSGCWLAEPPAVDAERVESPEPGSNG